MGQKSDISSWDSLSLAGKLLVATTKISDDCFHQAVVYLCVHNHEGAMGLIVNHRVNIESEDILKQLDIAATKDNIVLPVHFGGPVEHMRGFVLYGQKSNVQDVSEAPLLQLDDIALSASTTILEDIASGKGPHERMLLLGYAGWNPLQLEEEIADGHWLVADANRELIFGTDNRHKWEHAADTLGVDIRRLHPTVGHA